MQATACKLLDPCLLQGATAFWGLVCSVHAYICALSSLANLPAGRLLPYSNGGLLFALHTACCTRSWGGCAATDCVALQVHSTYTLLCFALQLSLFLWACVNSHTFSITLLVVANIMPKTQCNLAPAVCHCPAPLQAIKC